MGTLSLPRDGNLIYLCFLSGQADFIPCVNPDCVRDRTKYACPTDAGKCLLTAICPSCRWRSQPLSRHQPEAKVYTHDFPRQSRVPTRVLLAPIGNPEPRGIPPLDTPCFRRLCIYALLNLYTLHSLPKRKNSTDFILYKPEICGIFVKKYVVFIQLIYHFHCIQKAPELS